MKPDIETLRSMCPGIEEWLLKQHLDRLGEEYFAAFSLDEVCSHLVAVSRLSENDPVNIIISIRDRRVQCTVVGFDYPSELSLITGLFAGTGLGIESGRIYTYQHARHAPGRQAGRLTRRDLRRNVHLTRRCIIDDFSGMLQEDINPVDWEKQFRALVAEVSSYLRGGDPDGLICAKHTVNELVSKRLSRMKLDPGTALLPVRIDLGNGPGGLYTTLRIVAQDTPAFLYSLSNALALCGISIERVRIRTAAGEVEDEIDVLDSRGNRITDERELGRIRLSVLLTKQFTYFLAGAPDPYAALSRFQILSAEMLENPERREWLDMLSDPGALGDLARILGASDYIWEDFVRTQYETLLPLLDSGKGGERFSFDRKAIEERMKRWMADADTLKKKKKALNSFKDHEIFLIDLDHILSSGADVTSLAAPLTHLAELVVDYAAGVVYDDLCARHGAPTTVAGLEAQWAVFGLGKLGGAALGYASDIELLFVYSDSGSTAGQNSMGNMEFFELLAVETSSFIEAKQAGIFLVDLRLRPYGNSGPKACSMESFCRYYGASGPAHSYEMLALTRLRVVGGVRSFGRQVERLRDEFVYERQSIDMDELRELRRRQLSEKAESRNTNAKFSPGALVDLEYCVQILQVLHGGDIPALRTPIIHRALEVLAGKGVLEKEETLCIIDAYYFLRRLINGLRMLRGNAMDLFLPPVDSLEYGHLARRMGYQRGDPIAPEESLRLDFETHTAVVRAFMEKHFGRGSIPGSGTGNVADLVLSADPPAAMRSNVLGKLGFKDIERAFLNLRKLAGEGVRKGDFARLAVYACDLLRRSPDPDMALNNWEHFVGIVRDPAVHYAGMLAQPKRLEILLGIFAASDFLADALVMNPEFLEWVTDPEVLAGVRSVDTVREDLSGFADPELASGEWANALRRFRRREMLRIGVRDICLHADIADIVTEISNLAEAILRAALDRCFRELVASGAVPHSRLADSFALVAMGKLGGSELNYSSDIDLVGVYDTDGIDPKLDAGSVFGRVMDRLGRLLSTHTDEGYVYRIDLRLRPYGRAGGLAHSTTAFRRYYLEKAALWEIQALLKARPVAGSERVGGLFMRCAADVLQHERNWSEIVDSIIAMRQKSIGRLSPGVIDIKTGVGGLRDIEFVVQALQLGHACDEESCLTGNTIHALNVLAEQNVLPLSSAQMMRADYMFFRRLEHCMQLLEDRQVHALPRDEAQLDALAVRVMGEGAGAKQLLASVNDARSRVRDAFDRVLNGEVNAG